MGVGKESDIHLCQAPDGRLLCLKLHRLGRISFRTIKHNRDYLNGRQNASWQYLARLAAQKEFKFMCALKDAGFPVPTGIDQNRHVVLMEYIQAKPMLRIRELKHPLAVLEKLMRIMVRMVAAGIIHGDFNEFNLMIDEKEKITVIDFPQIVSIEHVNAQMYFDRDVACVRDFFRRRFGIHVEEYPTFETAVAAAAERNGETRDLASKCNKKTKERLTEEEEFMQRNDFSKKEYEDAYNGGAANDAADRDESDDEDDDGSDAESDDDFMPAPPTHMSSLFKDLEGDAMLTSALAGGQKDGAGAAASSSESSEEDSDACSEIEGSDACSVANSHEIVQQEEEEEADEQGEGFVRVNTKHMPGDSDIDEEEFHRRYPKGGAADSDCASLGCDSDEESSVLQVDTRVARREKPKTVQSRRAVASSAAVQAQIQKGRGGTGGQKFNVNKKRDRRSKQVAQELRDAKEDRHLNF